MRTHQIAKASMALASWILLSGFCADTSPPSPPTWVKPTVTIPNAHACSSYSSDAHKQFGHAKSSLTKQWACCGTKTDCKDKLTAAGSTLWDQLLELFALVHTNVPVNEKEEALKAAESAILNLKVCPAIKDASYGSQFSRISLATSLTNQ